MKHFSKILSRYLLSALFILAFTLFFNIFLYVIIEYRVIQSTNHAVSYIRSVAEELDQTDGQIVLSEDGYHHMQEYFVWAMVLSDTGEIIWDWNLPDSLRRPYTSRDIAVFSKWYLEDYPVTERITEYGLLVAAQEKGSIWKMNINDSVENIRYLFHMIPTTLFVNLVMILFLVFFFGIRFYRSLRVLEQGILHLSKQMPIRLPEKGMTALLATQLNQTSDLLLKQRNALKQRDDARTAWISGVSHDIRTPLSLIMGYASDLKEDTSLTNEQRRLAGIMEHQSLKIKHLIEDLNLTSRLEYHMQPLRIAEFKPCKLLRSVVSDFYNQGLSSLHIIDLYLDPGIEQKVFQGDTALLTRAFSNLIGNSIRHNPKGCTVTVTACAKGPDWVCFQISDDGCGIPKAVIQSLSGTLSDTQKAPHIMGLRIAEQIFQAHGWEMTFPDRQTIQIVGTSTLAL